MALNFTHLPLGFWRRLVQNELNNATINGIHLLAIARVRGAFRANAMRHIVTTMTPAIRIGFRGKYFSDHFDGFDDALNILHVEGPYYMSRLIIHCTSQCLTCFRFLEIHDIIRPTGFYDNTLGYFAMAGQNGTHNLQRYLIETIPSRAFFQPISLEHDPTGFLLPIRKYNLGSAAGQRSLVRAWLQRVQQLHASGNTPVLVNPTDFSFMITPDEMLKMASWIDNATAGRLRHWNILISEARDSFNPTDGGTMWHAVILQRNPARVGVFIFMQTYPHPIFGTYINICAKIGWSVGVWHPWATAIKLGDTTASNWFSMSPTALPLTLCSTVYNAAYLPVGHMNLTDLGTTKFIGWPATLAINLPNVTLLRVWARAAQGSWQQTWSIPGNPFVKQINFRLTFGLLDQIISTFVSERTAILNDSALSRAKSANRRKQKMDLAIQMLLAVIENVLQLNTQSYQPHGITSVDIFTLRDTEEYQTWLADLKQAGINDIVPIICVLETRIRHTRSGQN